MQIILRGAIYLPIPKVSKFIEYDYLWLPWIHMDYSSRKLTHPSLDDPLMKASWVNFSCKVDRCLSYMYTHVLLSFVTTSAARCYCGYIVVWIIYKHIRMFIDKQERKMCMQFGIKAKSSMAISWLYIIGYRAFILLKTHAFPCFVTFVTYVLQWRHMSTKPSKIFGNSVICSTACSDSQCTITMTS